MSFFPIDDTYIIYKRHEERFINGIHEAGLKAGHSSCTKLGMNEIKNLVISLINGRHEIPQLVRDDLSVVIKHRKEALVWYTLDNQADEGHAHHLRTLQEIWELIDKFAPRDRPKSGHANPLSGHSRADSSRNSFEDLNLVKDSERSSSNSEGNTPNAPDTKGKRRIKKAKKKQGKKKTKSRRTRRKSQSTFSLNKLLRRLCRC